MTSGLLKKAGLFSEEKREVNKKGKYTQEKKLQEANAVKGKQTSYIQSKSTMFLRRIRPQRPHWVGWVIMQLICWGLGQLQQVYVQCF